MLTAIPSKTALRVALRRAAHQLVDAEPLVLDDPISLAILPAQARAELARTPDASRKPFSAGLRAFLVCRSRLAEDNLAAAVARPNHPATQYVLLGAGLDTFAYRNPHPHLRVFEVDHPATQQWKRDLLAENKIEIPPTTTFAPIDFETETLPEALAHAGFDPAQPTVFAWLGVVPYLTLEAFRGTIQFIGALPAPCTLTLDYSLPRASLGFFEKLAFDSIASRVAKAGEPFRLFFTPAEIAQELRANNFTSIEDLDHPALAARYLANRTDGLDLRGGMAHLLTASKP